MVRFSDILNKISKKHGAKPTVPKPLDEKEIQRHDLSDQVRVDPDPGRAEFVQEPTQEINSGIMEQLFRNVLETPPAGRPNLEPEAPPGAARPPKSTAPVTAETVPPPSENPPKVRGFRNHAELLKFASLLINDIEDAMNEQAG